MRKTNATLQAESDWWRIKSINADVKLEAAQQRIAELEADSQEIARLAGTNAARAQKAEAELARQDAAAGEPVTFDSLRDAVAEITGGIPHEFGDGHKGHEAAPFMNFNSLKRVVNKFAAAQPSAGEPDLDEQIIPKGLNRRTAELVQDFAKALAEKLLQSEIKYGWSDGWMESDWKDKCLADFHDHIVKGDPRDVAAYCAFMWHHEWPTAAAQPSALPPEMVADNTSMMSEHAARWYNQAIADAKALGCKAIKLPKVKWTPCDCIDCVRAYDVEDVIESLKAQGFTVEGE